MQTNFFYYVSVFTVLRYPAAKGILIDIPELGKINGSTTTTSWTNRTVNQFLGVRFAKSPSGDRRFKPPEFAEPWDGIFDATSFGRICPQFSNLNELINSPPDVDIEDCLSLDIYVPEMSNQSNKTHLLPVIFYIHGGEYYKRGSKFYTPHFLLEHDVIFLIPQYRLGPLGFLCLHTDDIAGNMGFLDLTLALQWVKKYIKYFGGDSSRVTTFGSSSGASMAYIHLITPLYDPSTFQQTILLSGSPFSISSVNPDPISYAKNLFNDLTNGTQNDDIKTMEDFFKKVSPVEIILSMTRQIKSNATLEDFFGSLVVQKAGKIKFFTQLPHEVLNSEKINAVPMIASVAKNDGSFKVTDLYDILLKMGVLESDDFMRNNLAQFLLDYIGIEDESGFLVDTLNTVYFKNIYDRQMNLSYFDVAPVVCDIVGNILMKTPMLKIASNNRVYEEKTFLMSFDYKGEFSRLMDRPGIKYKLIIGTHHADDLQYLLQYVKNLNQNDTEIAILMSELVTSFVINGQPSSDLLKIEWPQMDKYKNGPYLHVDSNSYVSSDFIREYIVTSLERGLIENNVTD